MSKIAPALSRFESAASADFFSDDVRSGVFNKMPTTATLSDPDQRLPISEISEVSDLPFLLETSRARVLRSIFEVVVVVQDVKS